MTLIVQWLSRRTMVPDRILFGAGQISGAVLLIYLYMRFWDTTAGNYGYVPGTHRSLYGAVARAVRRHRSGRGKLSWAGCWPRSC